MDKYDELKYNPQFLKKAYDLVKEDFPKLFRDDNNYTKEDEKNWDIALDKIYNNFVTPEEQDFIEIWGETDGTIGLIDHIYKNKNKFELFDESTNKYVKVFRESCRKLEEEITKSTGLFYITFWHDDDIDTVNTLFFDNDKAFHKFYNYLISLNYDVIDKGDINNIIHNANAEIKYWQENYF